MSCHLRIQFVSFAYRLLFTEQYKSIHRLTWHRKGIKIYNLCINDELDIDFIIWLHVFLQIIIITKKIFPIAYY